MSLRIKLYVSPDKVYSLGERIQGHIELDIKSASQKDTIDKVQLSLACRAEIEIARRERTGTGKDSRTTTRHYRSTAILFWRSSTVTIPTFQPPASRRGEDGGTLSRPFEVEIPGRAEALPPEVIQGLAGDIFSTAGPFPGLGLKAGYELIGACYLDGSTEARSWRSAAGSRWSESELEM